MSKGRWSKIIFKKANGTDIKSINGEVMNSLRHVDDTVLLADIPEGL